PTAEKPRVERVHVIVRASPAHARIAIDETRAFENPSVVTFAKDGARHTMHVEADGYSPRDETFDANGDRTFVLALEPNEAPLRSVAGPHIAGPTIASPPPPPGAANGGLGAGPGDKCCLGLPETGHPTPAGSADDARSAPHAGTPANAHHE
ncbi:MAG: hypothetical protein M3O36_01280, partial [Myxococcota bacterium]|nr:hypothetical protein [Myxococcota bacterium]